MLASWLVAAYALKAGRLTYTNEVGGIDEHARECLRQSRPEAQHPLCVDAIEVGLQFNYKQSSHIQIVSRAQ